jgi:two-component system, cell cycle sensor histidine kinase and response regulator CckA
MEKQNREYRVLVVDDHPVTVRTLCRVLRRRGFEADQACDGMQALEIIRNSKRPYDLLITDIIMPGMSGLELVEYTEDVSPDTKFLLISAFLPDSAPGLEGLPFFQKPFGMDAFTDKVQELCRSRPMRGHPTLFLHR